MQRAPRPAQVLRSPLGLRGREAARSRWSLGKPCRAMAPVTESNPCSRLVTRAYSRSRSPLSVSTAEASRRASFWLSLAANWKFCACRVRSAAASWSRFSPSDVWLAITARITAPIAADAPRANPPQHAAVEFVFLGQQTAQHAAGVVRLEAASEMVGILGQNVPGPPKACRITVQTLTGNAMPA